MRRSAVSLLACILLLPVTSAEIWDDEVPAVDVPSQLFRQQLVKTQRAWIETSMVLPTILNVDGIPPAVTPLEIQKYLDRFVTVVVIINPEARVKVIPGPQAITFEKGWYSPQLIKVINEGGITARLEVTATGDTETTARLYEDAGLPGQREAHTSKLTGQPVEYQALLIRSMAPAPREITLSFQAGKDTKDLGQRAELPRLITPRVSRLPPFIVDKKRKITISSPTDLYEYQRQLRTRVELVTGHTSYIMLNDLKTKVESEEVIGDVVRRKISLFDGEMHAYLLLPRNRQGKLPTILCLHQTTKIGKAEPAGLGGLPNLHYALELAQRGFITVAPDYPGYGDAEPGQAYKRGYASTTAQGVVNHKWLIDWLCTQPEVDPDRLGCIGHSLGGHNTLFLGLFDERIKVLATSCGFCSFDKYYGGNLKGWSHAGYMPRIASLYQCDPKQMPFDFTEILAVLAPRPVFINAPLKDENFAVEGVRDCVKAATPIYRLFDKIDNLVAEYPDAGHDFPRDVRERCYAFFAKHLK